MKPIGGIHRGCNMDDGDHCPKSTRARARREDARAIADSEETADLFYPDELCCCPDCRPAE